MIKGPFTVKIEGPWHSVILAAEGKWVATVKTNGDQTIAEAVRKVYEDKFSAGAKGNADD